MRKIVLALIVALALGVLAGCDNSHRFTIVVPANPSGGNPVGFSNASMNGTYIFTVHGVASDTLPIHLFAVAGTFVTDGAGNIVSGTRDTVNDLGGQRLNESITGTYSVNADGRGQAILNGGSGQVIYRFVLQSPSSGKLFQDGTTSRQVIFDAVGTIEKQSGAPATPVNTFIVRLDGEDTVRDLYGAIGGITFTGIGIHGTIDENDGGIFSQQLAASGTITLSGTRGSATLSTPGGINSGTHHFIAYFSASQIELLSTDADFFLYGHAEAQQGTFVTNTAAFSAAAPDQVFSLTGFDNHGSRVEIGRTTLGSTGSLLNAIEDIDNSASYFAGVNLGGSSYTVGSGGRWTASLVNATGAPSPSLVGWQVSPQRSIVLTTDSSILETGVMLAQSLGLSTATVNGNFAEALSGFNSGTQSNIELTASVLANGSGILNGVSDSQQDDLGLDFDFATFSAYAIDPTLGRATGGSISLPSSSGAAPLLPVVSYAVDANTVYFLPAMTSSVYQGMLLKQTP